MNRGQSRFVESLSDDERKHYDDRVDRELLGLLAKREAKRRLADDDRNAAPAIPEGLTLRARLARPVEPVTYRIEDWQPAGSRAVLVAQFKAGKTTLAGNTARCLVDGDQFLGRYDVTPVEGTVALLDFEMGERQLDAWLRAQRIRNDDRVVVFPMRGAAATFDLIDASSRAQWADRLKRHHVEYLILDCLRPCLDTAGLDEHHDAGRFLVHLDALLYEAGIPDCLVVHHMGHNNERARGDSRILDWPDATWTLVRQDADPASTRFIKAYGRDVEIPESELVYEAAGRRLTITDNRSRRTAAVEMALNEVRLILQNSKDGLSMRAIERACADGVHGRDVIREAVRAGIAADDIDTAEGPRGAILHSLSDKAREASARLRGSARLNGSRTPDSLRECAAPYKGSRTRALDLGLDGDSSAREASAQSEPAGGLDPAAVEALQPGEQIEYPNPSSPTGYSHVYGLRCGRCGETFPDSRPDADLCPDCETGGEVST